MQPGDDVENSLPLSSSYGSLRDSKSSDFVEGSLTTVPSTSLVTNNLNVDKSMSIGDDEQAGSTIGMDASQNISESASPVRTAHPAQVQHLSKSRQYYRDMMLGVNDGLVSTFLLVVGVVGGGMDVTGVLLTAIAGAIAGAISMFAGEYVATKSQNEVMKGEIKLEREHIKNYHAEEVKELTHLLNVIGIPGSPTTERKSQPATATDSPAATETENHQMRRSIIRYYASNPDALLKIMIALEFGVIDGEVRSPTVAGAASFVSFLIGSLPSVIPFIFAADIRTGLIISGLATGVGLFTVGAIKTWATRGNMWLAALENLAITAVGSGIAYGIGVGFDALVGEDLPQG